MVTERLTRKVRRFLLACDPSDETLDVEKELSHRVHRRS